MRKREGTSGVIVIKIARDSNALSVFANYPSLWRDRSYKNGFRYIPQIEDCGKTNGVAFSPNGDFRKNQWVRPSCKFALCQPTQFLVGGNIRYLLNERSTSLFSYQLHMAVSCEDGVFFGHHYWVQQFREQYARVTNMPSILATCWQICDTSHPVVCLSPVP